MMQLARAGRYSALAFNAAAVEMMVDRVRVGGRPTIRERRACAHLAAFLSNALVGFRWTKSLIEDTQPPTCSDDALDDFRLAVRIMPEEVKEPEQLLERWLDAATAYAESREASAESVRDAAQRISDHAVAAVRGTF